MATLKENINNNRYYMKERIKKQKTELRLNYIFAVVMNEALGH